MLQEVDTARGSAEQEDVDAYLQPAFKFDDAACNALLAEARDMEEVLAGRRVSLPSYLS